MTLYGIGFMVGFFIATIIWFVALGYYGIYKKEREDDVKKST